MPEYTDDATVRIPAIRRPPVVPVQRPAVRDARDLDPPTGPIRAVEPVAPQSARGATTARRVAVGALALLAVCAVVDALLPIGRALGANVGYVPISITMAFAPLLPMLAAVAVTWTAWAVHSRDERAPVIAAGVAVGVVFAAVTAADDGGPGLLASVLAVAAAVAAWLSTADRQPTVRAEIPASFGAAQVLLAWSGAGCLVAVVPAVVEAAMPYSPAAAPAFAAVLWLLTGTAALAVRTRLDSQPLRWAAAGAALVTLLAAALAGGVGWALALAGVHLTVAGLLLASTTVRRHVGEPPLALTETAMSAVRGLLGGRPGTGGVGPVPTAAVPAFLRRIPLLFWLGGAVGLVLFLVGVGTYGEHSATADSCTVASAGRWSLVEDTPECDAAFSGLHTGQALMVAGALAALALPARAFLRSDDSGTPSTSA